MRRKLYISFMVMAASMLAFLPAAGVQAFSLNQTQRLPRPTPTHRISQVQKNGDSNSISSTRVIVLRADSNVSDLRLAAPQASQIGDAATTVSIDYIPSGLQNQLGDTCSAFPEAAKTAFTAAANIWGALFNSSVPIIIEACWTSLPPGVLGHSGSLSYHRNFTGAPEADTWYPASLANALTRADLEPGVPDMSIAYSSNFASSFYYGTDGNAPANRYDFETIVMHEVAHGLGFSGSMLVTGGIGSWGYDGAADAYDHFTQDQATTALMNTSAYPNPSITLGSVLTSGNVFFSGTHANAANGGQRVKLYTPINWVSGTSYSHLDEIFNGTANALMTYSLSLGESLHDPGPITSSIFQDLGWPGPAPILPSPTPGGTPSGTATPMPTFSVSGRVTDGTGDSLEGVFFSYGQGTVATSAANGNYTISGLTPGTYRIVPSKNGYVFSPAYIDVKILTTSLANQNFQGTYVPPAQYLISGSISDELNEPVSGVSVSLQNGDSVTSDSSGNYVFTEMDPGVYLLTPSKNGYTFMPASRNVSLKDSDATAQDFIGHAIPQPTFTISGKIADTNGFPMAGVIVSDEIGHSIQTDNDGNFGLGGLPAGTYNLTPLKSGYTFEPFSLSVTIVNANVPDQDFTAAALPTGPYFISGKIKDGSGAAIANALVTDIAGYSALSDDAGNYSMSELPIGSYKLSAVRSGYQFTAAFSNPIVIVNANVTDHNFIGSVAPAGSNTISGMLSDANGAPLAGVSIEDTQGFFKTVSDVNGQYIIRDIPTGTYVLRAVHGDDVFTPALRVVSVSPDATAQDFRRMEHHISVNSTEDEHDATAGDGQCLTPSGVCTLRAAIEEANAMNDASIIQLPAGTYILSLNNTDYVMSAALEDVSGNLPLSATLSILGSDAEKTVVDVRGNGGAFEIDQTDGKIFIEMNGLTIQGGNGSGILARNGSGIIVLKNCVVRDNHATGILTHGFDVILERSVVSGNKTYDMVGGMDVDQGMTVMIDSIVSSNEGTGGGVNAGAGLLMTGSTLSANRGTQKFGGLAVAGGAAIVNSTISGNTGSEGGGVWASGAAHFYNATIVKNEVLGSGGGNFNSGLGGGIYVFPGSSGITLHNTILAENHSTQDAPDCFGIVTSAGYSLIGDKTGCTYIASVGDVIGYDPGIDGLDDHGGFTPTHAILVASWAIDAGNPGGCVDQNGLMQTHDQRGSPRPMDGKGNGLAICDIGSFEYQPVAAPYKITGQITDDRFQPLADATIFLNNGAQTISDRSGTYSFIGLVGREYSITVARKDYKFSPQARQVGLPPDAEKQNFVGIFYDTGHYKITGRTQTAGGASLAGVTITLDTGLSTLSDGHGYFSLEGVSSGVHTINASLRSYVFKPDKLTVNVTGDLSESDFIGTKK